MDAFAVELSDLIDNDEIPQMDTVTALSLTGAVEESIAYVEAGGPSYSDEDVYFLQSGEESLPLDTDLVEDYLGGIRDLVLTDYATYNATEIELASFGLNDPALTVTVEYERQAEAAEEGAEPETTAGTLALHIGRVEEAEESAEETDAAAEETEESAEDAQEEAQYAYYLRVGDSQIVYNLSDADGEALFAGSYDDLRHRQVFWGDFDDVAQATILLDNQTYTLTAQTAETAETAPEAGQETIRLSGEDVQKLKTQAREDHFGVKGKKREEIKPMKKKKGLFGLGKKKDEDDDFLIDANDDGEDDDDLFE